MKIKYVVGDLFAAIAGKKNIVIPHICNDVGAWGAGFVVPLGRRYPLARETYLQAAPDRVGGVETLPLGMMQMVLVDEANNISVANMVAQRDTCLGPGGRPPVRYATLAICMTRVVEAILHAESFAQATKLRMEIHAPMFGAGLAGGNWEFIATLIQEIWIDVGIPVTIYSLDEAMIPSGVRVSPK